MSVDPILKTLTPAQNAAMLDLLRRSVHRAERRGYRNGYEDAVCGQAAPVVDDPTQLDPPDAVRTAVSDCARWLTDALRFGARPTREIEAEARAAGHSARTLRRARSALGVRARRVDGRWTLGLPE